MAFQQPQPDIPLQITSEHTSSERRITPSWTISYFKGRLETITGIPPSSQRLILQLSVDDERVIEAANEDSARLEQWPLRKYALIKVEDLRPQAARPSFFDGDAADLAAAKYTMPDVTYENLTDSVLAWKKKDKLGRFDPTLPAKQAARAAAQSAEIETRGIRVGERCRLLPADSDDRRGIVAFVGEIPELPGAAQHAKWVGLRLDEPVGKNDGSVQGGARYFECPAKHGVFVQPDRVEVGDFAAAEGLGDEADLDEDMEEI